MKLGAVLALAACCLAKPGWSEVILACTFDTLPQIIMTYPDGVDAVAMMEVGGRPAAAMNRGQGTDRFESADVDGYHFRFHPASMTMSVAKDGQDVVTESARCATIGGPSSETPLSFNTTVPADDDPPAENTPDVGLWNVSENKSQLDDSTTVVLSLASDNMIAGQFGGSGPANLFVRCMENTTSLFLVLNDMFLADIQGFGIVTYRIDDKKAQKVGMDVSTDNKALGLWSGGKAIPLAKALMEGERLVLRATPFNESPVEANFAIKGLATAIEPLRKACKW